MRPMPQLPDAPSGRSAGGVVLRMPSENTLAVPHGSRGYRTSFWRSVSAGPFPASRFLAALKLLPPNPEPMITMSQSKLAMTLSFRGCVGTITESRTSVGITVQHPWQDPGMPDWSPVGAYGGYQKRADSSASHKYAFALACGCKNGCKVHGHAYTWNRNVPVSDVRSFCEPQPQHRH